MDSLVLFFQSTTQKSWRDKLTGVYRFAREAGWQVQVVEANSSPAAVRTMLKIWQPIGCIVDRGLAAGREPTRIFGRTPLAFLDQRPPRRRGGGHSLVIHDSAASARCAAAELLAAEVKNFTYVPWKKPAFWSDEREKAFAAAVRKAGSSYLRWTGSLSSLPRPCGVLCANDMVAQQVLFEARACGLKVPKDLLVVGIDNDPLICENTQPTLTSVLPDFENAGYQVAQLLAEAIEGKAPRLVVYGPVRIVRRESSRWLAKDDPRVTKALSFIKDHAFDHGLKSADVVEVMGCSRRLADLRFREATGHSIHDEVNSMRMERAFELLSNPRQAIGAIPALCGYASEPFFKRLFKQTTGLSMRSWRKRHT